MNATTKQKARQNDPAIKQNSGNLRQSETFGGESRGLNCEDRVGMFEAGLEELAKCFHYDAMNTAGGVRLTISGVERIDHEDGTWSLRVMQP